MRIVVGVTGGIAAYKVTSIIRQLTEAGHDVKVIPTQNALRFIGAATLEALSHNSVDPDLFTDVADVKHVELGQQADLVLVAPATAAFVARFAAGIADDLLGNVLLATKAPIVIAPAMHTEMWQNPATLANIALLKSRGILVVEPAVGRLTGSDSGPGRLAEPDVIVSTALSTTRAKDLNGVRIAISAGGTIEPIDPVRFIANRSSGKQGLALALEAQARGAEVTLIAANISELPAQISQIISVESADQLERVVESQLDKIDVLIMAAAVSDFRVESPSATKVKKSTTGSSFDLRLVANPDVLVSAVAKIAKEKLSVLTVSFAAETVDTQDELEAAAKSKLAAKGCRLIVANNVSGGAVFSADDNEVLIVSEGETTEHVKGNKSYVAGRILDTVARHLN